MTAAAAAAAADRAFTAAAAAATAVAASSNLLQQLQRCLWVQAQTQLQQWLQGFSRGLWCPMHAKGLGIPQALLLHLLECCCQEQQQC
jgi:hypothetical protein